MNEKLKTILVEIPTIVLSVIIALGINEWNNERERKNLAENVVGMIKEELDYNRTNVQKAYLYHVPLVDELTNGTHRVFSVSMEKLQLNTVSSDQLQLKLTELFEELGEVSDKPLAIKQKEDSLFTMTYKQSVFTLRIANDTLKILGRGNISLHSASIRNNAWRIAQAAQIAPYLQLPLIAQMSELDQLHANYTATVTLIIDMLYKGSSDVTPAMQDMISIEKQMLDKYDELELLLVQKN